MVGRIALLALLVFSSAIRADPPQETPVDFEIYQPTIIEAFPPPKGATRVPADAFGQRLQSLRLRESHVPVRTHEGTVVHHRARVIELPLVPGDLQQCADSALRLRAEFLRDTGKEVMFHATSGDAMPWSRYRDGERAYAVGNGLKWKTASPASWQQYLSALFTWAGTASLEAHDTVPDTEPTPGDVMVQGGFPGHAILLLDVAKRGEQTFVLVGEGYMPAQDFHVELGAHDGWWLWRDGVSLPHWNLPASSLRTWK